MIKNKWLRHFIFLLIGISPLLYLGAIWYTVPEMIPLRTQYNFRGEIAALTPRNEIWSGLIVTVSITVFAYLLSAFIGKVDPKRAAKPNAAVFQRIGAGLTLLLTTLSFIMLFDSVGRLKNAEGLVFPLVGVLFAFLGNVMHHVKPNYFIGIRLPWTLNDDYNWKMTHQLAGKLWFGGGLVMAISYLVIPTLWNDVTFFILILALVGIPSAYSFMLFKKTSKQSNTEL